MTVNRRQLLGVLSTLPFVQIPVLTVLEPILGLPSSSPLVWVRGVLWGTWPWIFGKGFTGALASFQLGVQPPPWAAFSLWQGDKVVVRANFNRPFTAELPPTAELIYENVNGVRSLYLSNPAAKG